MLGTVAAHYCVFELFKVLQLYSSLSTFAVCSNESQDVLVSEQDGLINLCLPKPGPLVPGGEDLHRHILPSPLAPPHLTESTLPNSLLQHDGPSYGSLHQQWQTCETQSKYLHQDGDEQQRERVCVSRRIIII